MGWLLFRVGMLAATFLFAYVSEQPAHEDFLHPAPLHFVLTITGVMAVGAIFITSIQAIPTRHRQVWRRPSWRLNPFNPAQPLTFLDFGGFVFLFLGLGYAAAGLSSSPPSWFWEITFFAGLGLLIGVRVAMFMFKKRMDSDPATVNVPDS